MSTDGGYVLCVWVVLWCKLCDPVETSSWPTMTAFCLLSTGMLPGLYQVILYLFCYF